MDLTVCITACMCVTMCILHGIQRRMFSVDNFFVFLRFICSVVAIFLT